MEEPKIESEQELQAKLNAAKQQRSDKCWKELEVILNLYNCQITTNSIVTINGQPIVPIIQAL